MVSVAFTGDVAFSGYFKDKYDSNILDGCVADFLRIADHVVANVEGAVTDSTDGKEFHHSSPEAAVDFFKLIGADIWCLGNNHTFDLGVDGVKNTRSIAENNGFKTIGAGRERDIVSALVLGDNEVALISVTYEERRVADGDTYYGTLCITDPRLKDIISCAKKICRWCAVIAHCGDEFAPLPLPYVRRQYHKYLEYGADIIVGHHPHVVQNYETVGDKIIFYSIGNFVFDTNYQRTQNHTDLGVLLKLCLTESSFSWEHLPIRIDRDSQKICKTENIPVFRDINEIEYEKLWPLSAKMLEKNTVKAWEYLHRKRSVKKKVKDGVRLLTHLRNENGRDIFRGRIKRAFVRYDKCSELYKFIGNS